MRSNEPSAERERRKPLRVLLADESQERLERLADMVLALGDEVVARETDTSAVGCVTADLHPDVALVQLGSSREHALVLVEEIVREAACPVIAVLSGSDPEYVRDAARRGIFAYIVDGTDEDIELTLQITLERFSEYHALQGAFGRRAIIEQAKGILMARRGVGADEAFTLMRRQSQRSGRRVFDLAIAILDSHGVLVPPEAEGEFAMPDGRFEG